MNFPTIKSDYLTPLKDFRIGYVTVRYDLGPTYIKVRMIRQKRGKKKISETLAGFIYVEGEERLKIFLPNTGFITGGYDTPVEINPNYTFLLGGSYGREIELSNPRMIYRTDIVVCDIKYKNGGI